MRRRQSQQPDRFLEIFQQVEALKDTDFDTLATWLNSFMETASVLPENSKERHDTVAYVANIVKKLPLPQSRRFLFDAYLLQTIRDAFNLNSTGAIILIPIYATDWGHEDHILFENRYLSFVHIPDNPENTVPELLEYTWLIHELGHYIIRFEGKPLLENYAVVFNRELSQLRLRAGAYLSQPRFTIAFVGHLTRAESHI